jgi:hypothetical protein
LKALEINKRSYGEDHVNYATILINLAVALEKLGDYGEAK